MRECKKLKRILAEDGGDEPTWRETYAPGYYANADGEILGKYGRVLKPRLAGAGYLYISASNGALGTKNRAVHRLVCHAFHGPPPSPLHEAAHNNGNQLDNRASNLRWATKVENERDKELHGTANLRASLPGEKNGQAKLSWDDADFIRESVLSVRELMEMFGVSEAAIRRIRWGKAWVRQNAPEPTDAMA